ncbi:pre-mRNA 3'-end-processing factor FIP1 isoform X3 [Electrophorus electricus]|uniref:pre-mRNA 3'-end-processing factor FIP1 isoform X3 n=1 Tax=Electrophorus electricus TaxID=8005 RepID=UPI000F09CEB4|nr:pre-mRNA 3'-end-processing factor FIP1 isoform X3 [Electrophorus electricus]
MSAEEADKTTTTEASAGDEEEEWLYGDEGEAKENEEEEAKLTAAISATPAPPAPVVEEITAGNGVVSQEEAPGEGEDSESDSDDDDDDVRVTIGDIKTGAPQAYGATPVNLNIKTGTSRPYGAVGAKVKGVDLDAPGSINGVPVLEVDMELFEEKPWRKPGADLSDYFNYGFSEETWKAYCEKQKRLRMGLDVTMGSTASKISVQQGRTGNDKEISLPAHITKTDFTSPPSLYKTGLNPARISPPQWAGPATQDTPYYTKSSGTIDVIGGQTATISRVEGRRRHNLEGNNIQVISEHSSDAESTPAKMPTFFPPGPIPPTMPPPPFLPPPTVSQAPPLLPPPRLPITVPPPGFPPPPGAPPPSLIPTMDNSGHPGGYDCRPVAPYTFPPGGYPPPMQGPVNNWPTVMENAKPWDYYSRRDKEREKERERERPRERGHDREREREHSPSSMAYNSDEERYRYRDYGDRGYERHRERSSREKEERHRERRHRDKEEGRHKSSRSSSRRRHDSEEGDSHRRHKHKKSKRSKEGKEPSEERTADQENQDAME